MRLGIYTSEARELLRLHRESYPVFWGWSNAAQDFAMLHGYLEAVFGCDFTSAPTPILAPCATSRCRRTERKCCGWPAA